MVKLSQKELKQINGGGLSEIVLELVDGVARYWMRKGHDSAYIEADFMVYKM